MPPVISIENISKSYHLGVIGSGTLREDLQSWWHRVRGLPDPNRRLDQSHLPVEGHTLWALQNVSLEIQQGEVWGIIGRNGAGKSTLLKILSRVTAPTSGRIRVKGRVASLLEVGTGFHPELTGRENIFLNGAILGMTKAEVARKLDEIVAFSELETFIDTPVKRYSSGMYVRLAFAVAAHLEPEILVVDEVLAVGDLAFQKKCLGKMQDIGQTGRTVLFVSHNMQTITRLCQKAILLDHGRVAAQGEVNRIAAMYGMSDKGTTAERTWPDWQQAPGDAVARLKAVRILNAEEKPAEVVDIDKPIYVEVEYWNATTSLRPTVIIHLINSDGVVLFASNDWNNQHWHNSARRPGVVISRCVIPPNFMAEGSFFVLAAVGTFSPVTCHAMERDAVSFRVVDRTEGTGSRGEYAGTGWPGVVRPYLDWKVRYADS